MTIYLQALSWVLGIAFGLVFLKSGSQKLRNPLAFQQVLRQYGVLPPTWLPAAAPLLTTAELTIAIWLALPLTRLAGAGLGIALQCIFITVMSFRLGTHFPRGCGCFELNVPQQITWRHIGLNVALLFGLGTLVFLIVYGGASQRV